jgi:single-stranded DNA-binding protein
MYKTLIIGNIGADATVKEIGERQVVNFSVAVQVRKDLTQWVECSYWRNIDQSVKSG